MLCFGFISCNRSIDERDDISKKAVYFNTFLNSLDECLSTNDNSIEMCMQGLKVLDSISDKERELWREYGKINLLVKENKILEATHSITSLLADSEYADYLFLRGKLLYLRGILNKNNHKLLVASEDYYQAANIFSKLGLNSYAALSYLDIANIHYNTGNSLLTIENGEIAQDYLMRQGLKNLEDSISLMHLTNTLGLGYLRYNMLDSALMYFKQSNDLALSLNQEFWAGLTKGNMGLIYQKQGLYDKAVDYYENDIKVSLENKEFNSAATTLMKIAEIYIANNRLDSSRLFCDSAYVLIMKSVALAPLSKYYEMMSKIYSLKDQHDSALYAYKKHIELGDSLQSLEINTQLQQIQNQKRFEQQLAEFNLLKAENDLRKQELIISYISIVAVLVILLLVTGLLLTIRKKNKQLREMNLGLENEVMARTSRLRIINKELDTYLYRASHDVRRPILSILGLLQIAELTDEAERGEIRVAIRKTANEMDQMLRKLRMAYLLEKQNRQMKSEIQVKSFFDGIIKELSRNNADHKIELQVDEDYIIESNQQLLEVIFLNIIENACTYAYGDSNVVKVFVSQNEKELIVRVVDSGIGLSASQIEDMYDPYVRFSNLSNGSGIGLHLVKRAARKLGVQLKVKSKPGEGTEFMIHVPVETKWKKI